MWKNLGQHLLNRNLEFIPQKASQQLRRWPLSLWSGGAFWGTVSVRFAFHPLSQGNSFMDPKWVGWSCPRSKYHWPEGSTITQLIRHRIAHFSADPTETCPKKPCWTWHHTGKTGRMIEFGRKPRLPWFGRHLFCISRISIRFREVPQLWSWVSHPLRCSRWRTWCHLRCPARAMAEFTCWMEFCASILRHTWQESTTV